MNPPAPQLFTASEIAEKLGKDVRAVRRWLSGVRVVDRRLVRGNLTAAYSLDDLPAHVQRELQTAAKASGCTVAEFMGARPTWKPEFPWREICPEHQQEALLLQRALMPALERRDSSLLSDPERAAIGCRDYEREFGSSISPERWRYLFDRTLQRDAGAGQFHRPELFLSGNLRRAVAPDTAAPGDDDFKPLNECLARFHDSLNPSGAETDALWLETVELFMALSAVQSVKKLKRRLLDFLWRRAPFLAKTSHALRVNLERKLKRYENAKGDAVELLDGRALKRGEQRAAPIPQEDIDRLAWHSGRNCGGRTTQAVREFGQLGERSNLTPATLAVINAPHTSKSHVNRRLFEAVHRDAKAIFTQTQGRHAKNNARAKLILTRENLHSMDCLTADDFTMPVLSYVSNGKGGWILTRGQVLIMHDARSLKIVGWCIQPEKNYNSLVIRTLMNRTCQQWGVPKVWYYEAGIWKHSSVVKNAAPVGWKVGLSQPESKIGWAQLGVKFIHAKEANAKPGVERVGGLLQDMMERFPGYTGREQRHDCPEVTRLNQLAVESGRVEPHGRFLSFDAWEDELGRLITKYNATVQQGKILQGLSPDQAFEAYWPHDDPPTKFGAGCWHLLAHYVSERSVGVDGIRFRIGSQLYLYRDENSSDLRGRTVHAWFDPEFPEFLGVTDLKGRNPRIVQRAREVHMLATLDRGSAACRVFEEELKKAKGHDSHPKARYHTLKAKFEPTFRQNLVAPGVAHVADTFGAERTRIEEAQKKQKTQRNTATSRARKLGIHSSLAKSSRGLELMMKAAQGSASESTEATPGETT